MRSAACSTASPASAGSAEPARVAALYDLHGNVAALDAALDDVVAEGADLIVFGGDLVWGPFPRETLERALDPGLPARYVRGNADREVAARGGPGGWVAEITQWCADRLDPGQRDFLLAQEETVALEDVLFCHGTPRSDEEALTPATPEDALAEAVAAVPQRVVVCGHTHMQFDRAAAGTRVVNAGSVGMPYEGVPGAYWCLLDGEEVTLRRTVYDFDAAAAAVKRSGCPYAEELAKDLVAPPSRDDAIASFGGG